MPAALLPVLLAFATAAPAQPAACPPGERLRALTPATVCVINAVRAHHGLPALRHDRRLARAARRHSRDMVARRYFAHTSPEGVTPRFRIAASGWMRGRHHWRIGENLAWRSGRAAPGTIVRMWLRSPGHRRNLLDHRFRAIGIGVAQGTPASRPGATYTADFGS
jgi:uncharacterized protein YkwD